VLVCFTLLSCTVLALTPPWEANDEPWHVQNTETILSGHWYRITHDANLESIQFPLYYMVLAGYQKLLREPVRMPDGVLAPIADNQQHGNFVHDVPQDGADQRLVDLLRLPNVVFGLLTIVFTFFAARRVARDPWTPVVAAAIVAGVPKFVFVSGVINNDNLSNAIGGAGLAAGLALVVAPPLGARARRLAAVAIGLLAGAVVLTKITGSLIVPGLLLAVVLAAPDRREALKMGSIFLVAAFAVCGWWLVHNQVWYGDPIAGSAAYQHQREVLPGVFHIPGRLQQALVEVPKMIWSSFWYSSGWNQFSWRWFWYLPFWALSLAGVAGLVWRRRAPRQLGRKPLLVCSVLALGALASIWALGIQANTEQGRLAFMGLPAIALLIAFGYERLRVPVAWRFLLPTIGLIGTIAAIRYDVIIAYAVR
jgi:hypothetical protein